MWDTHLQECFKYDENGYPLKVPVNVDHPNADTSQMLITVWANTFSMPEGTYVELYCTMMKDCLNWEINWSSSQKLPEMVYAGRKWRFFQSKFSIREKPALSK